MKRSPAPWSFHFLVSLCRLSAITAKLLLVSAGLSAWPSWENIGAITELGPALRETCECMCLCTGARPKTLIVRILFLYISLQRSLLYSQSHLDSFKMSAQFWEFSSAAVCVWSVCLSSQAPRKMHTTYTSTVPAQASGPYTAMCVSICVSVMNVALQSYTSSVLITDVNSHCPECPIHLILMTALW